jgi:hypothetical protein
MYLIFTDDKHKISIRKDVAVFTIGVQNQHLMIIQDSILAVADHDFTKLFLTLLVIFFTLIFDNISRSFYNSQVFVSYKNTMFEPSTVTSLYREP